MDIEIKNMFICIFCFKNIKNSLQNYHKNIYMYFISSLLFLGSIYLLS
jgi:hypothetical protein